MFKNIQLRIVIVFFLIGIITIAGLGTVYINSINVLENNLLSSFFLLILISIIKSPYIFILVNRLC